MLSIDQILEILNQALELDRAAVSALMFNRTPCNRALTDHPTIQTGEKDVGPMGLINGFVEPLFGNKIMFVCDDSAPETILKFEVFR